MTIIALASLTLSASAASKDYTLSSPDGKLSVEISTSDAITYSVLLNGTAILRPSAISMTLSDGTVYGGGERILKATTSTAARTLKTVAYKKAEVTDNYNELKLEFKSFDLFFRAYDDGAAYRFVSKSEENFIVSSEQAEFAFPEDWRAFVPYVKEDYASFDNQFMNSFENYYEHIALSQWNSKRLAFLPLVVEAPDGVKICVTESDLLNYPGMFLNNPDGGGKLRGVFALYPKEIKQGGHNMLEGLIPSRENYLAKCSAMEAFPWRIVMVAREARELMDMDLVYRLGTPAAGSVKDWSWVKPGKVAWDWWNDWNIKGVDFKSGVNNDTYKYYIDFASAHNIEYVILDEGWAVNKKADLMQVVPAINLEELVSYASSKNVDLILWAGYWAFNRDIEGVCEHYAKMGIKGFKVDFMNRDDQIMVDFYRKSAEIAAKHHLLLDFHGAFKPAGLQRTYPNVINFEGVAGLEQMKWGTNDQVTYDVTIPFVRMAAGSMDYTQGAMRNAIKKNFRPVNSEPMSQGTRCHQLAEYVIFDAPLTMLCDSPSNYIDEPECTGFIAAIPTIWQKTVALDGEIAEYAVMAKQAADGSWYVGALNNWTERDITIDMKFLENRLYEMTCYQDGANADKCASDFKVVTGRVPGNRKVDVHLAPGGGWAAHIVLH